MFLENRQNNCELEFKQYPQKLTFGYNFHENKITKTHLNTLALLYL
jgi:hypothetical protein